MDDSRIPPAQPAFTPWPEPAPEARRSRRGIWVTLVAVVLALGCLGGAGYAGSRALRDTTPVAKGLSLPDRPDRSAAPGATPGTTGPRASSDPVRTAEDLKRVCEQWYFPKSPKVKSSGTQPVSIFRQDSKSLDLRHEVTLFDIPDWYTAPKQKAWDPSAPGKVRLVACVDLVDTGTKKIRTCKFDDPKDLRVPMREAKYRLSLYEVATGKRVLQKTMTGEDDECPFVVLLGADRTIYSQVGDRQFYQTLKKYVEK
jgi:hypothetical protein